MSTPIKYEEDDVYFDGLHGENAQDLYLVTVENGHPVFFRAVCVRLSVGEPFLPQDGFVKNYSENSGMDKWLEENGIASPTGITVPSGYVQIPMYTFNIDKVREHLFVQK